MKTSDLPRTRVDAIAQPSFQTLEPRVLLSADILHGPPQGFATGFGEPGSAYYAQTFQPTADGFADTLTFQAQPAGSPVTNSFNDTEFRVLVTEVAPGSTFEPTTVLFESGPVVLPPGDGTQPPDEVTIDLQGLALDGNTTYAWIIDSYVEFDGTTNQARVGFLNGYADGEFLVFNATSGTRADHFSGGGWFNFGPEDMSFNLTFLSAPNADAGGPYAGTEGVPVTLDASASTDPDNDIVLYEWDTDYDGVTFDADLSTTNATIDFTYADDFAGTVAVRVTDAESQSDLTTDTVTIANADPAVAVTNPNTDAQYSDGIDTITFAATDVAGDPLSATIETSTDGGATFTAGLPDDGTVADGLTFSGSDGQSSPASWTVDGVADLAPGTYTFRVTVTDDDGGVTQSTADLVVNAEDAAATYTGPAAVSTEAGDAAGSFAVELRATVQEASLISADADPGDLATAGVTFRLTPDNGDPAIELTAAVNPDDTDPLTGFATATFSGALGAGIEGAVYTVEVLVDGNYTASDAAVLTIARPDDSRAFGAGSIIEQSAQGGSVGVTDLFGNTSTTDLSIADDSRVRFGLFADFRRQNSDLRGRFSATFRDASGDLWALSTTDLTSFTTAADPDGNAATRDFAASLIGTARLINLSTGQFSSELTLLVDVTDNRNRGIADTIGFSLWDGDELALSSNWDGTTTVQQDLNRGNTRVITG